GALTARALAKAGHTVYASMRETRGRNAPQVEEAKKFAKDNDVDLRAIELDVSSQESCDAAIQEIIAKNGRLDVVIHNAGHMVFGPAEAFTPEQLAELYDVNVRSTQRVNRAALPELPKQKRGLCLNCTSQCGRSRRRGRHREGGRYAIWRTAFPRPHRSDAGWSGSGQYSFGSGPCRASP